MSVDALNTVLVKAVTESVLERNPKDPELFANPSHVIVQYFHIEVGVQVELLTQLVKKIESENNLVDRPVVKAAPPKA